MLKASFLEPEALKRFFQKGRALITPTRRTPQSIEKPYTYMEVWGECAGTLCVCCGDLGTHTRARLLKVGQRQQQLHRQELQQGSVASVHSRPWALCICPQSGILIYTLHTTYKTGAQPKQRRNGQGLNLGAHTSNP